MDGVTMETFWGGSREDFEEILNYRYEGFVTSLGNDGSAIYMDTKDMPEYPTSRIIALYQRNLASDAPVSHIFLERAERLRRKEYGAIDERVRPNVEFRLGTKAKMRTGRREEWRPNTFRERIDGISKEDIDELMAYRYFGYEKKDGVDEVHYTNRGGLLIAAWSLDTHDEEDHVTLVESGREGLGSGKIYSEAEELRRGVEYSAVDERVRPRVERRLGKIPRPIAWKDLEVGDVVFMDRREGVDEFFKHFAVTWAGIEPRPTSPEMYSPKAFENKHGQKWLQGVFGTSPEEAFANAQRVGFKEGAVTPYWDSEEMEGNILLVRDEENGTARYSAIDERVRSKVEEREEGP
jgi:hypothetical protein